MIQCMKSCTSSEICITLLIQWHWSYNHKKLWTHCKELQWICLVKYQTMVIRGKHLTNLGNLTMFLNFIKSIRLYLWKIAMNSVYLGLYPHWWTSKNSSLSSTQTGSSAMKEKAVCFPSWKTKFLLWVWNVIHGSTPNILNVIYQLLWLTTGLEMSMKYWELSSGNYFKNNPSKFL